MNSRTLIIILLSALTVSILGLIFFGLGDGFGGRGHGFGEMIPRSFWLVLIIVPLIVVITVLGYSMVFPELGAKKPEVDPSSHMVEKSELTLNAVLRVLNEDERKVVKTLVAEGGVMLQKDIRWKTGFSRVKTHRVLYRLAKRGIVSAEKHYNTNRITLVDWLMKDNNEK